MKTLFSMTAAAGVLAGAAFAYPEGAPWGADDLNGAQSCVTCHFDFEAEENSTFVSLDGLPETVEPDETYKLTLHFAPSGAEIAGFLLSASAGVFHHAKKGTEANEQDVRSTAPLPAKEGVSWTVTWTAPEDVDDDADSEIIFYAAVNGANNDMSSFGDRVYFRTFVVQLSD
ncbi:choice-of-anchor V domain-containing protein [Hyphococcus sp.]|uniref:choice-of-anchor V domain-containing protein n=1 Tax=Hyphococcus sp. TaxID=2038636 RepID=UPI0035C77E4A